MQPSSLQSQADVFPLLQVLKHRFTLTDADQYVKYMEAHAEQFPLATIQSLQKNMENSLLHNHMNCIVASSN